MPQSCSRRFLKQKSFCRSILRDRERDANLETDEKAPIILESKVSQQFVGNLGPPGAVVLLEDVQQRGEGSEKTTLANRM